MEILYIIVTILIVLIIILCIIKILPIDFSNYPIIDNLVNPPEGISGLPNYSTPPPPPPLPEKILWEIFVPASSKDNNFTYEHHKIWDNFVLNISGGLTILRTGKGQWICPEGKLFKDRIIPVRIACTHDQIEEIIDFTIKHYNQEAVMCYKLSPEVIIKYKN